MGVTGLLPALAVEAQKCHYLKKARGAAVGIDLAGWLHESAANNYAALVLAKNGEAVVKEVGESARSYVIEGVKPVFVIDGRHLDVQSKPRRRPSKPL